MFKKILIANRGEIAVRVIRACREMGIVPVAVFSEADRRGLHLRLAEEAYPIGPAPSSSSYLVMDKLIGVAKKCGAEAIHPGYGFLAENADFAEAVESEDLAFIGPSPAAMRLLGDKLAARQTMVEAGLPVVPGTPGAVTTFEQVKSFVDQHRLPVLIKAAYGGGGKGMRILKDESEIESSLRDATAESKSHFADGTVYLEKYLENPRHVEIQILADKYGNIIYLGERECSIQRRHQKVIEESPSPIVDEKMRRKMGKAAVGAAKAAGYVNAGTVEFLVDKNKKFYFLEVNTRLQVEHPVTEMVTGLDLVKEQIKIAAGEKLRYLQQEINLNGAAIECRIYAEDPDNDFMPSTGLIKTYREPSGPGVRVDSGVYGGFEVPVYYDPLISKLIAWGKDREEAIQRMRRALDEYHITGVSTTIPFHRQVLKHPILLSGEFSTHFIDDHYRANAEAADRFPESLKEIAALAAVCHDMSNKGRATVVKTRGTGRENPWKMTGRRESMRSLE
jgi:acetyl-CoA carboxylase biotin carboxylase subunit